KRLSYSPVEQAMKILDDEIDCFHSLNSLSKRIFIHPVYLARAFKLKNGITIGEYQLKQKLSNAIFLLLNSALSISDISFKNGFYDDAHFIRNFKSRYAISPHQFRLLAKS
ncbi:MAG: helix-turn-helix transcriptional regulator, partial [Ferruginibacter sp.]